MSLIFLVSVCLHLFPPSLFFFLSASSSCCSLPSASILTKWRKPLTTSWPWRRSTLTPIHSETLHFISHLCYFITYAWVLWLIKLSLVSALWIPGLAVKAWLWKWINNTHFLLVTHSQNKRLCLNMAGHCIQTALPLAVCPQAGYLSSGQPAADCGLQEPGGGGGEAAPGTLWLWKPQAWGHVDEGTQLSMATRAEVTTTGIIF